MDSYTARNTGWLILITGIVGALAFVFFLAFAVGFLFNIPSLLIFGGLNDLFSAIQAFLSAILAWTLFAAQRKQSLILSITGLLIVCFGTLVVILDSGLGISGTSIGLPSRYDLHVGWFLIGAWLVILNTQSLLAAAWLKRITILGLLSGLSLIVSMSLAGTPWVLILSIPYPVWCIWLGRYIVKNKQVEK